MKNLAFLATTLMIGCADKGDDSATPTPTLSFLAPADGATVTAGTVDVTIIVDNMTLEDPSAEEARAVDDALLWLIPGRSAWAHNEGAAEGYAEISLDGAVVAEMYTTQAQLTDVAAGEHTLTGALFYTDGDALEPPVTAEITFTAGE